MSWGIVAGAAIGVVGGAVSSRSAAKSSKRATDSAEDAANKQLGFEQERYDDWNSVYGPIQDNLANYYNSVSPDYYASVGLEAFEQENDIRMSNLDEMFAQRGIDPSSGIAASLEAQGELGAAETRAGIRRDAPRAAAEDQSRFLQIGLGQNPASSVSSAMANRTSVASQQAGIAAKNAASASKASGEAFQAAIPAIGKAIDAYNKPKDDWSGTVANQGGSVND
jgi:hypothetical protein